MKTHKRSRILITAAVILIAVFLLSPFLGGANSAGGLLIAKAAPSLQKLYLPLVKNNFPAPYTQTIFGVEMESITGGPLDQMAATNMSWVRKNAVVWSSIEPTLTNPPTFNWSVMAGLETEMKNASSKGMQMVLIVRSTPEWARKLAGTGPTCGPMSQSAIPAFGAFMRALVARYSVAPYNVKYWELWNEEDGAIEAGENIWGCWGDTSDPYDGGGYYATMLKTAYPQIKAADSNAQVLIGGLLMDCDPRPGAGCAAVGHSNIPPKFLEGILRNGGGPYFNGVSFHAYDWYQGHSLVGNYANPNWGSSWDTTGPSLIAKAEYIKSLLSQYNVTGKYLLNTELAVLCGWDGCDTSYFETTKANFMAQSYAAAMAEGLRANIWYSYAGWNNSGLYISGSTVPAYTAFKFARNELSNAAYTGALVPADIGGLTVVKGYKFLGSSRRIWVLWSVDGNTHASTLPGVPVAAWDAMGNPVSRAASMNVSVNPLYLEWNP